MHDHCSSLRRACAGFLAGLLCAAALGGGPAWAQLADVQIVVTSRTATTTGYNEIAARCPAGWVALSGGVETGTWTVTTLAPTFGNTALFQLANGTQNVAPDGWYASVDVLEAPSSLALAVVCARPAGPVRTVVTSARAAYGNDTTATAQCPAGFRAVGGGIDVERASTLSSEQYRISASAPLSDGSDQAYPPSVGWRGRVYGAPLIFIVAPPPGPVFKVGAVCVGSTDAVMASSFGSATSAGAIARLPTSCPAPLRAIAGGALLPGQKLLGLRPQPGDDSALGLRQRPPGTYPIGSTWQVDATRDTSASNLPTTFNGFAVCATVSAGPVATGTVVEFYYAPGDRYFITSDPNEAAAIDRGSAGAGWSRTGLSFRAGGPDPVCRFYGSVSPGPNSHFYTVDPGECQFLRQLQATTPASQKRWNFEGFDFGTSRPAGGACPAGTVPVYRAYNNGASRGIDSNHRLSTSLPALQQLQPRGWVVEGLAMCAPQ